MMPGVQVSGYSWSFRITMHPPSIASAFLSLRPGRFWKSPWAFSKILFQWIFQYHRCTPGISPFHFGDFRLAVNPISSHRSRHGDTTPRNGAWAVDWNKNQCNMWKMWIILTDCPGIYWIYSSYSVIIFFINTSNWRYIQSLSLVVNPHTHPTAVILVIY
jgi:hypothetical protein